MNNEIAIVCIHCNEYLTVPVEYMGKTGICPYCDKEIYLSVIPQEAQPQE